MSYELKEKLVARSLREHARKGRLEVIEFAATVIKNKEESINNL